MTLTKCQTYLGVAGSAIVVLAAVGGGAVWAMDQRYWTVSGQKQFEVRQLKREVKKAELLCKENSDQTECAYYEFLRQELEQLQ